MKTNSNKNNKRIPIWLDCDPGIDDLFAILLCCESPQLDLKGISCSSGNSSSINTSLNVLKILNKINRLDIAVIKGNEHPLNMEKHEFAEEFHGKNGLEVDWELPSQYEKYLVQGDWTGEIYKQMREEYKKRGEKITWIVTGPCTNLALLLKVCPLIKQYIEKVIIMGGALGKGNITLHSEYNIWSDPEAADVLLQQKNIPITLVTLEATHQVCINQSFLDYLSSSSSSFKRDLFNLFSFYQAAYRQYEVFEYPPCHDMLTVVIYIIFILSKFYLINQHLFLGINHSFQIDCQPQKRGQLIHTTNKLYNQIQVINNVQQQTQQLFLNQMIQTIDSLDYQIKKFK